MGILPPNATSPRKEGLIKGLFNHHCHCPLIIPKKRIADSYFLVGGRKVPVPLRFPMIFDQGTWRPNGKYKYGGGVAAEDGAIYCFPSDVALDTITGTAMACWLRMC